MYKFIALVSTVGYCIILTYGCDNYSISNIKFDNCKGEKSEIKIVNASATLTKDCIVKSKVCYNSPKTYTQYTVVTDGNFIHKPFMNFKVNSKDTCKELADYNIKNVCPIKKGIHCIPNKENISKNKHYLSAVKGPSTGKIKINPVGSSSSCIDFSFNVQHGK